MMKSKSKEHPLISYRNSLRIGIKNNIMKIPLTTQTLSFTKPPLPLSFSFSNPHLLF